LYFIDKSFYLDWCGNEFDEDDMLNCVMDYRKVSSDGKKLTLSCVGVGDFDVLSGIESYINNPNCSDKNKAAIPPGTYWIVDRPGGSVYNSIRADVIDMAHLFRNHHNQWFGLFNAQTMSDYVYVNHSKRNGFRLHPLNSDGSGESWGCITLYHYGEFTTLRRALLSQEKEEVPNGKGLKAYGSINVIGVPDFSKCVAR
jgi:hypothetical protein